MSSQSDAVRPYAASLKRLRDADLRPTRQRLALAKLLFESGGHRHVTAERLHEEAVRAGVRVSLATVYNTLHQFTEAGLLKELVIESSRTYFDTNTVPHHHFYNVKSGSLQDIDGETIQLAGVPEAPQGCRVCGVHVVIYLED